jgi:hypothetical protein
MKTIYSTLVFLFFLAISAKSQSYHTITSQAEFDNAMFANFCVVELNNDTTLPLAQQIHDLSPLQNVDSVLLTMRNTRISDGSPLADLIELRFWVKGDTELSDLSFLNNIPRLGGVFLRDLPKVEHIDMNSNTEILSQLLIENCNSLETLEVDLPDLEVPSNPHLRLKVYIRYNDSLQNFSIRNPNEAIANVDVEENRSLKEIYVEQSGSLWLTFNPVLESIYGFENKSKGLGFKASFNYMLEEICSIQSNLERTLEIIDSLGIDTSVYIELNQNGPNTSTLQDILDYPCAPASVENNYTVSKGIYPNPTHGILNIQDLQESTPYKLINLQGQLVQKGIAQPHQPLHIEQLPSGIYFLELEGTKPVKVVKQ